MDTIELVSEAVQTLKTYRDVVDLPWKIFLDSGGKCDSQCKTLLRVAVLCIPCNGFGDIVFSMKLKNYVKEWYGCETNIITTDPNRFIQLGEKPENIYVLKGKTKVTQCLKYQYLSIYDLDGRKATPPVYDLLLVALTYDFDPEYRDIKYVFPYSNRLNTFFFSEYNDKKTKLVDFHTGVGNGRDGIFMIDVKKEGRLSFTKRPYAVVYVNLGKNVPRKESCTFSFIEMICKKYSKKHHKFDIFMQSLIGEYIIESPSFVKKIGSYFDTVIIETENERLTLIEGKKGGSEVVLRANIFPIKNTDMLRLIRHSVRDILLTGDQSVADTISCCAGSKNIFYQRTPWKENFGKSLAKHLPNKYLEHKTSSCGSLDFIKYKSDYTKFKQEWDFRKRGRAKMDSIMLAAIHRKTSAKMRRIESAILSSRSVDGFIRRADL